MRKAKEAIVRERHPIPTVDEVLQDMTQNSVFTKLDLKWGYHQLELSEESRDITTFTTHAGIYRYKRLMFGMPSNKLHMDVKECATYQMTSFSMLKMVNNTLKVSKSY